MMKDSLYAKPLNPIDRFTFDQKVVDVFDDMIKRSVPGYEAIMAMITVIGSQFAQDNSRCYDLGCSLGTAAMNLAKGMTAKNCSIMAIDNSEAMIQQMKKNMAFHNLQEKIEAQCQDIWDVDIVDASIVILNFTLQFIDPHKRLQLIEKIHRGMEVGGVLILSDKIAFEDEKENEFQTKKHCEWKKLNGYSDLEIAQKRTALENVLIPDTLVTHKERLAKVGFQQAYVWFQCFNFASIIAIK